CWPKSISVAERLSAAACEKPVIVTSRDPTLQRERTEPSFVEELAAVSERASVYVVRDGPASGETVKVCAVLLRLVTVRVRVAGVPVAVTMPKSSSEALSARGSAVALVAGSANVVEATP